MLETYVICMPQPPKRSTQRHRLAHHLPPSRETVDPSWLLKALLAMLALGIACAYIAVCGLFFMQQWQLVLHPSRTVSQTPAAQGLAFQDVHFSPATRANQQIDGWWIPADNPADPTALLLHNGTGTMADALVLARQLHEARLNVLVFDYRGFGHSQGDHPTEQTMEEDSEAALTWLSDERHIRPAQILPVGQRGGASLAVRLCVRHPALVGLVLVQADGDFASRAAKDVRARIVPFRLLFRENFPLADPLSTLKTPKLLISYTEDEYPVDAARAADPKMTFEVGKAPADAAVHEALRRFLETYVTEPPRLLIPAR